MVLLILIIAFLSISCTLIDYDFLFRPDLFWLLLAFIATDEKFGLISLHKVFVEGLRVEHFAVG